MSVIAFDTSNYTTSIAYFDGTDGKNCSKLLPVKDGLLGLRQSDAVFHHTQCLPVLSGRLFSDFDISRVTAVGVSTRPRAVEGSYMPCFTVGYSHASMLANALGVPLFECSHQQGHIAASMWSADRMDLVDQPHLAWHLSGGTTELLYVEPAEKNFRCQRIGGTTDISAGQLIDRTGQMLHLPFPSGKHVDVLSKEADHNETFKVKCSGCNFSLSGVENKVQKYSEVNNAANTARYALNCIIYAVEQATKQALTLYPGLPVLFSGGVASNSLLRDKMQSINAIFCNPEFSTDNAMGVAILTWLSQEG